MMQPIVSTPGIIELFGPSGSGKSTFALQVVASCLRRDETFRAIYVCTDDTFSVKRFEQLYGLGFEDAAERIIVQHLGDLETQEHFLCYFLHPLVQNQNVNLVIIDSISSNFRPCQRTNEVTASLYSIAKALYRTAAEHSIPVICINQVTADLSEGTNSLLFKPALGLSWSNCVTSRLRIERVSENTSTRIVTIVRCPLAPSETLECQLTLAGFRSGI
ncbi:DNA repair protein XRCC3 [Paramicrosporidium saccamoebae]|uniref:DNA repair protein XRCC3 n=1 Tax=Paramicrosporidium saccamoebae TaxID=1246581 RepID=A0A2H9TLM1_9FUNG|nr:DNA repair protein XRCC3 [Paramicrosporidium saccamoebae]